MRLAEREDAWKMSPREKSIRQVPVCAMSGAGRRKGVGQNRRIQMTLAEQVLEYSGYCAQQAPRQIITHKGAVRQQLLLL